MEPRDRSTRWRSAALILGLACASGCAGARRPVSTSQDAGGNASIRTDCPHPLGLLDWSWARLKRVEGLSDPIVIVTFDAGLELEVFERQLDLLAERRIRATAFLMAAPMRTPRGEALLRRLVREGHELANHTLDHPHLTQHRDAEVRRQIQSVQDWVQSVVGRSTRPFFREPYLDRDARVDRIVRGLCYRSVWFTLPTRDDVPGIHAPEIVEAVLGTAAHPTSLESGSILMFHGSQRENLEALPVILDTLRARGHAFLPLGEALVQAAAER